MGITIHYSFCREMSPEVLLKKLEPVAEGFGFKIEERSWNKLIINPHEDSECITLHFHKAKSIKAREGYDLEKSRIERNELGYTGENEWFCSGFVKTQYAGVFTHIKVAEFLRVVSSFCQKSSIYDEADYYEKGYSEEALEQTKEHFDNSSKMISQLLGQLKDIFGKNNVLTSADGLENLQLNSGGKTNDN